MDKKTTIAIIIGAGAAVTTVASDYIASRRRIKKIDAEIDARTELEIRAIKIAAQRTRDGIAKNEITGLASLMNRMEFETIIAFNEEI